MKNIFRFLMAVAILFTASCTKEDISSSIVGGGEVEMTFTVDLQDLGSRAYGDGAQVNTLRYYVYDGNSYLDQLSGQKPIAVGAATTVNLVLLKGMTYNIVFWADHDGYYTYNTAAKTISVDYSTVTANEEWRDAFCKFVPAIDPATASNDDKNIVLTRPFAQLNAVATDMNTLALSGVNISKSKVTIDAYSTLNLATGEVSGLAPKTLVAGDILENGLLSMNYFLAPAEGYTPNVTFTFENNKNIDFGASFTYVPLKRNYRTNIIGSLLSKSTDFTVTIKKNFFEPDKDIVQTAAELQQQIENAPDGEEIEIVLGGDIDLNDLLGSLGTLSTRAAATPSLTIPAGKNIVLNLNGCTLSATENSTGSYALITNNGTLTISDSKDDGKIELTAKQDRGWNAYSSVLSNQPGGVLTVNGGTIEHLGGTDMAYGIDNLTNGKGTSAVATINGGAVKSTYIGIRQFLNGIEATNSLTVKGGEIHGVKRSIWMQGPSANKNSGNLEVTAAAKLYGNAYISTAEGTADWDVSMSIAAAALQDESTVSHGIIPEGYSVVEENGVWTVTFTHIANIGEDGYNSIQDAVAAVEEGETIIVNRNATFNESNRMSSGGTWYEGVYYVGDKSFTIDLNNNTISQNGAVNDYMFLFKNDGEKANTITFKNGTIDAGTAAYCALCTSTTSTQKITINLEGVNLIGNNSGGAVAKIRGGAELNVNAGTVITGKDSYVGIEAYGNNTVVNINEGAKIYQNGTSSYVGSLAGASGGATLNVLGGEGVSASGGFIVMTSGGTVNISGGNWTANTDGTYANGNNSVLISQSAEGAKCTVNVTGGTFKGGYNCYGDAVGDATINIYGGNFNANPSDYVVAGKAATENNGTWTIIDAVSTAEALAAALAQGGVVTLGADITLTETAVIAEGKSVVLDLNGKTLAHEDAVNNYALNNHGTLTIKGNGIVNARGIYNGYDTDGNYVATAKLIIENGTFNAKGTNGGAAVYNYGTVEIKGGKFESNGGYGLNNQTAGVLSVANAEVKGGIYNQGNVTIENSTVYQHLNGKHAIYNWTGSVTIQGGEFDSLSGNELILADGQDASVVINGGTFNKTAKSWLFGAATGKNISFVINGGTHNGYVNKPEMSVDTIRPYGDPIVVTGGTFNFNPTNWLAEGRAATENNGVWTVE